MKMPTLWSCGEGRCTWVLITESTHVIFRGSRGGMLRKISSPVLETRCCDVEEHQLARIRQRSRVGPYRESEGSIVPLKGTGQHNPVRGKGPCFVHATEVRRVMEIAHGYTRHPFYGSRKMVVHLRIRGHLVNRKRVQRLMGILCLAG
jgi:hypothetical protein